MNSTNGHHTATESFGSRSIVSTAETQSAAMQAQAQAAVQARFVMALKRPRSWDDARVRILAECARPGFAEVARYRKPIGDGVEGPSIRFAEACARHAGNMGVETVTTYEDERKRIIHVAAIDYETNASFSADVTVTKTVERRSGADRVVLAQRTNKWGKVVYIVEATEDELLNVTNALVSKATRTLILRLIPGDIIEEGQEACMRTLNDRAAKDPAGERKRIADAFAAIGVMPSDLERYLGHKLDGCSPAELVQLRKVYGTIRDGETTWREVMQARESQADDVEQPAAAADAPKKKNSVADKIGAKKAQREAAEEKKPDAPPPATTTTSSDAATAPTEAPPPPPAAEEQKPREREPGEEG